MEVEGVLYMCRLAKCILSMHYSKTHVADSPRDSALFTRRRCLVSLAVDTQVHDMVATDGAVVDNNVPSPESDCIPLYCCVSSSK